MDDIDKIVEAFEKKFKCTFYYTDGYNKKLEVICTDFDIYRSGKFITWSKIMRSKYKKCKWYAVYLNI